MADTEQSPIIVRKAGQGAPAKADRRVARTLDALLNAFIGLVLEENYRRISIGRIVERANVGRSTFYEHFRSKDDILIASMGGMFEVLADAACPDAPRAALDRLVAHFWSNRQLARAVLAPPIEGKLRRALAAKIEERLAAQADAERFTPRRIVAVQIAAAQLALLDAWTRGELSAGAGEIAGALAAVARR